LPLFQKRIDEVLETYPSSRLVCVNITLQAICPLREAWFEIDDGPRCEHGVILARFGACPACSSRSFTTRIDAERCPGCDTGVLSEYGRCDECDYRKGVPGIERCTNCGGTKFVPVCAKCACDTSER
jgi:hypothetical protein